MKPLCIDLYCGLGGWAEGFLAEGYDVIGFDIERHGYWMPGTSIADDGLKHTRPVPKRGWTQGCAVSLGLEGATAKERTHFVSYPGQLVLQDVLTLDGAQFRNVDCIVASPPCQAYSYRAMPWKKAKALPPPDNALFDACFRIQREASEAAGHYIPMVVENVCGAQRWVGSAKWHYGSYYLWGDVPALMPYAYSVKGFGGGWCDGNMNPSRNPREFLAQKVPGFNFHEFEKTGKPGGSFQPAAVNGVKVAGLNWSGSDKPGYKAQAFNSTASSRLRAEQRMRDGTKVERNTGRGWFGEYGGANDHPIRNTSSRSDARKQASALIAKIPFPLAQHIAQCFKPEIECGVRHPMAGYGYVTQGAVL